MTNVVMVMPYRAYVSKAKEEGLRVCAVWDATLEKPDYLRDVERAADAFVLTDFSNARAFDAAVRRAAAEFAADYVYHVGREDTMLATYRIAEQLGTAVNPARSIELLNDKLAMRELLREHDVSSVRFATARHWREAVPLLDAFELPVVVKPTALAGSRGVYLLRRREELSDWGALLESYGYDGPVLVEEYLRGPEFSVETMSDGECHHVVGVTRKSVGGAPLFVETGHAHPLTDATMTEPMGRLAVRLLELAGYRRGPAHTEVIWTAAGPRIVESQARLGGDRIPRLVELSTGVDIERAIFQVLAGRPVPPARATRVARIGYFDLPRGRVEAVSGLDEIKALDFVDDLQFPFDVGDEIPETRDSKTRHGFVIVTGRSEAETAARVRAARSLLRVSVRSPAAAVIGR